MSGGNFSGCVGVRFPAGASISGMNAGANRNGRRGKWLQDIAVSPNYLVVKNSFKIDLRMGGKYLACMRSPEGQTYWSTGVYREIVPKEKIVYTDSFSDAKGNVVPASHYGMSGDWPSEMLVTVTFQDDGSNTIMTLRHDGIPPEMISDCETGWGESFDKLAVILNLE